MACSVLTVLEELRAQQILPDTKFEGAGQHLHVVSYLVALWIGQKPPGNGGAEHAGHHKAGKDHPMGQVLPIGT